MIFYIILGVIAFVFIVGGCYLVNDSRKKGMHVGGKLCGGCPDFLEQVKSRNKDIHNKKETTQK